MKKLLEFVSFQKAAQMLTDPVFIGKLNSATFEHLMKNVDLRREISHLIQR